MTKNVGVPNDRAPPFAIQEIESKNENGHAPDRVRHPIQEKRDTLDDVDIGYAYLPRYWSKGYAIEAALAMKDHARDAIGLKRLVAVVDPQNAGSIRLVEKLGMTFERMVRLAVDDIDLKLYSMDL